MGGSRAPSSFAHSDFGCAGRHGARCVSLRLPRHRLASAGRRWCRSSRPAPEDRLAAVELLAQAAGRALRRARSSTRRMPAAEEEIAFAASLSDHPKGMLAAVSRKYEDGAIREAFRTLTPSVGPKPLRAYAFLEVVGEEEPAERGRSR